MRLLLCSVLVAVVASTAMAAPNMTAVSFYAADSEGTVIPAERWNTLAPHPAWDVYVAEGAIPGGSAISHQPGADSVGAPKQRVSPTKRKRCPFDI